MADQSINAGTNSATVDGNWSTFAAARTGNYSDLLSPTNFGNRLFAGSRNVASYYLYRAFMFFDLSSLSGSLSALGTPSLRIYSQTLKKTGSSDKLVIVAGLQSNPVVDTDFAAQNADTTIISTPKPLTEFAAGRYDTMYFTSAGTAIIGAAFGGTLQLCLMSENDAENGGEVATHEQASYFYSTDQGTDYAPKLVFTSGVAFPSDTVARVSSIRHVCRPGFYRMQVGLGDLGFDIDTAEATVRMALDTAKEAEPPPPMREPQLPGRIHPRYGIIEPERIPPGGDAMERLLDIARQRREPDKFPVSEKITAPQYLPPVMKTEPSLWQRLTPWKEEEGETFGSEVMERVRSVTRWLGGLFK